MGSTFSDDYFLGLDIGPNSIGWSIINGATKGKKPTAVTRAGVIVFPAGLNDLEFDGKGISPNAQRRDARGHRRLIERNSRRMTNLAFKLQKKGLFPDGLDLDDPIQRNAMFDQIQKDYAPPYILRTRALDEKIALHELGRALYHMAQRRGFLSNRKSLAKENEEKGKVKEGIASLNTEIISNKCRTLGEYFSKLDPHSERIRGRYTDRNMYKNEFEQIFESQRKYYSDILTDDFKKDLHRVIFYQRPLKNQKYLIGECSLMKGRKRAPKCLLSFQRFRYLQKINDMLIFDFKYPEGRELSADERKILIDKLEVSAELKFAGLKKLLKLPKASAINLERSGDDRLDGNKTAARLIKIYGEEKWMNFSDAERNIAVEYLQTFVKPESLKKKAMEKWNLDEEPADKYSKLALEEGYCQYSRQALAELLPLLETGKSLQTIIKEKYPERFQYTEAVYDLLPPLNSGIIGELRNPIVERTLTELRRVVNAIVKQYGKPGLIRIELGRDLRFPAKKRHNILEKNRLREKERNEAIKKISDEMGIEHPKNRDIEKILLAEECNRECPYTGKPISIASLMGSDSLFNIEHIIPYDRCLDDSFLNKTLCYVEENKAKGNRTPYEAYHGTPKWDEIIERIKKNFKGEYRYKKLDRFMMSPEKVEKLLDDFTNRQLNDMRWAAIKAKEYLGLLYGGKASDGIGADGSRKVQAVQGQVTAKLRYAWGLNNILGYENLKSRDDHRHHAVDAIVIALTTPGIIKELSNAAKRTAINPDRLMSDFPLPWNGFHDEVKKAIENIKTSQRISKRVRGALHKETFYGKPRKDENGKTFVTARTPIEALDERDIKMVTSPVIKEIIEQECKKRGGAPKDVFKDRATHPKTKNGQQIHRVHIRMNLEAAFPVGQNEHTRYVMSDSTHHIEIVKKQTKSGEKWDGHVVSLFEAYQRKKKGEPIIKKQFDDGETFLFSLAGDEVMELDDLKLKDKRALYVVKTVPQSKQLYFVPLNDARKQGDIGKVGLTALPETLKERHCKKVALTPLGEIRDAND